MSDALILLGVLGIGYCLGRSRPWAQAQRWIDWRFMGLHGSRPLGYWDALALCALRPGRAWRAWHHRHDPPKKPIPVERLFTPVRETGDEDVE